MTSHRAHPLVLLATLGPACYAPGTPVVTGEESGSEEGESGSGSTSLSTTAGDPTTADTTASTTASTTTPTDETGPDSTDTTEADSTGEPGAVCGDGMVEGDEVCDDGVNDGSYGGCLADCTGLGPHCGDGIEQGDEVCDDGDEVNGDGCNIDCVVSGSVIWTQMFAGAAGASDETSGVAVAPDDTIIAVGTEGLGMSSTRAWIQRYGSDGAEDWSVVYAGASGSSATANSVAIDDDGGVYAAGRYNGLAAGNGWARKYDDSGSLEYTHLFIGAGDGGDWLNGVAVSGDGYAVIAGLEDREDLGQGNDIVVRRLGLDGTEFWTRTHAEAASDSAAAVSVGPDGSIAVAGTTNTGSGSNFWLRKYSQDGSTIWTREMDDAFGEGVAIDASGRVVIAALTVSDPDDAQIRVRQYDADGTILWTDEYDSGNDVGFLADYAQAVAVDADSAVIVVGAIPTDDGNGQQAFVRKYTEDGAELWTQSWHIGVPVDQAFTGAMSVATDSVGNVILGGFESIDGSSNDGWVRKLAP